jgi:hypothetical protein
MVRFLATACFAVVLMTSCGGTPQNKATQPTSTPLSAEETKRIGAICKIASIQATADPTTQSLNRSLARTLPSVEAPYPRVREYADLLVLGLDSPSVLAQLIQRCAAEGFQP